MGRWTTAALILVAALATSCATTDFGELPASAPTVPAAVTTTTSDFDEQDVADLGAKVIGETPFFVDEESIACAGRATVDALGQVGAEAMVDVREFADKSDEEKRAVADAFNQCLDAALLARTLVDHLREQVGAQTVATPELVECLTQRFEGRAGELMLELDQIGSSFDEGVVLGDCSTAEIVEARLAEELVMKGWDLGQASCVAEQLAREYSLADIDALGESGIVSDEMVARLAIAQVTCGLVN